MHLRFGAERMEESRIMPRRDRCRGIGTVERPAFRYLSTRAIKSVRVWDVRPDGIARKASMSMPT